MKASSFKGELITDDAMKADDAFNENKIEDISTRVESSEKVTEGIKVPIIENGTTPLNLSSALNTSDIVGCDIKTDSDNALNDTTNDVKDYGADIVMVYATALLKNAPFSRVEDDTLRSISEIVRCKDHLLRNIENSEFADIRNRPMRCSFQFMHQVNIVVSVKKSILWETARSYVWKNLGSSSWTLHDGTEVSLIRIHQK